jgi:UDP-N-acetylmuramoyl-L-alanyl-D-glutamate--2,6-diaminopimelate ligase
MQLNYLLNNIPVIHAVDFSDAVEIKKITLDSREAGNNSIFIEIRGFKLDGHKFIPDAVSNGVSAVVLEEDDPEINALLKANNVVKILVQSSRQTLSQIASVFYDYPSSKLNLIGITGTKGKTTTSYYIRSIFDSAGRRSGVIGTNKNLIGDVEIPSKLTTPESHVINELLSEMVKSECTDCVMEVSSHSLYLSRVEGLDFNVGVFTNITSDHLDFHSTFENYLDAKKILFDQLSSEADIIYNSDDSNSEYLLKDCSAKRLSYALNNAADLEIRDVKYSLDGTNFQLVYLGKSYSVSTKLIGLFNAYNSTAAIGAALKSEVSIEDAVKGISLTPQVPGRFEVLSKGEKKVIIDYSHTADSLKKALEAIHHITGGHREIYTVFGCGGDRDKTKRPLMGRIAEELSTKAIVTSDNPRTENPSKIIEDIISGIKGNDFKIIEDRESAIKEAIESSNDHAVILIAGKGHENYQEVNGIRTFFSDKETAEKYL